MVTPVKVRRIQRQSPRLDIQYTDRHVKNLQWLAWAGDKEKETRTMMVRVVVTDKTRIRRPARRGGEIAPSLGAQGVGAVVGGGEVFHFAGVADEVVVA